MPHSARTDVGSYRRVGVQIDSATSNRLGQLPLHALTWVEQDAFVVPPKERSVVGPQPGWHLRSGTEDHHLARTHRDPPVN
jgi:hypothetical protein